MSRQGKPIGRRVAKRARQRLDAGASLAGVAEYVCQVCRCNPHAESNILSEIDALNPLLGSAARHQVKTAGQRRSIRAEYERRKAQVHQERVVQAENERIAALRREFESVAKDPQSRLLFGVRLAPADRNLFFAPAERREIVALRKTKLSTSKVRKVLHCSLSELNRWDDDGRLPHRFVQRIDVGRKMVTARFWLECDVEAAKPQLAAWRQAHELRKRSRRLKHPLKPVN